KLSRELLSVRQQLARLSLTQAKSGQHRERLTRVEGLTAREQELARQVRQAGGKAAAMPWGELPDLRRAPPADAVLIDVAHFRFRDPQKPWPWRWEGSRYAAWVTTREGPVRLIDLGPAEKIDEAVKQFREAMQGAAGRIKADGEEKAEKVL